VKSKAIALLAALAVVVLAMANPLRADTFGGGANTFTIDFVPVGNAGNAADTTGYGGVPYSYRMGTYETSQDQVDKATASGLTNVPGGPWTGNQPATYMSWYAAAAFVNWLNTSTGHQAAYNLTYNGGWSMNLWSSGEAWQAGGENLFRNKDAFYFLPSEDEWYKAAYQMNDGVTANYWEYATGSDTPPTAVASGTGAGTAVYNHVANQPAAVDNAGSLSPYGTMGQGGNVLEWTESVYRPPNDSSSKFRVVVGGIWYSDASWLLSSTRYGSDPTDSGGSDLGFRVASVPEPTTAGLLLLVGAGWMFWTHRFRRITGTVEQMPR